MSISVNVIRGDRKSACVNDAFSVVSHEGGRTGLLDIIPAYEIPGKSADDVKEAFVKAASGKGNKRSLAEIRAEARAALGAESFSPLQR